MLVNSQLASPCHISQNEPLHNMATSGQTLVTLPEEILSLFVGIYFSEITITLWSHCAGGLQCRPGDVPYHPPRLPTTFNILLSCKTLHRVASSVMFECIKIRYADTTWMLYHEDLHCLPLHEFRHIRLSEFPFQLQHVLPWAWPRLKTLEILNVYQETHLNSELGASRRRPAWHPELAESVPLVCEVYNEILHICQSRNVDISIDLLIHRGCVSDAPFPLRADP